MRRPEFLARQGRCLVGLLGVAVGRIMALEKKPSATPGVPSCLSTKCQRRMEHI